MSRCDEIRPLIYPYLDDELEADRVALVERHLGECPVCERRVEAERRFLARIATAGREPAPETLRARVEAILDGESAEPGKSAEVETTRRTEREEEREAAVTPIRVAPWRRWLIPVAAAAVLALLVVRPWGEAPTIEAAAFASDHAVHAEVAPNVHPFPEGYPVPEPPPMPGARLAGLSECVLDGRVYAHYTYRIGDGSVSVFLPMDEAPMPDAGTARIGSMAIVSVETRDGALRAVIVSDDLSASELEGLWPEA